MPQGLVIYNASGAEILNTNYFIGKFLPDSYANGSNGSAYYPELAANNGSGFGFFQYVSGYVSGAILIIPKITISGGTVSWTYYQYPDGVAQYNAAGYVTVGVV